MSEIIGRELEVGVAVEDTRGTPQTSAEKWIKRASANISVRAEHATDDNTRGVLEDSEGRVITRKWCEGEIESTVQADMIGYIFYNLYGTVSSASAGGSAYEHTFSNEQSIQHPSLSVFVKDGSVAQNVYDTGMIQNLEINATTDDLVRMTANFQAREATENSDTPSYDTEYDFVGKDITIKVADTEGELDSADAEEIKDVTITWDAGTMIDYVLGQYAPQDIFNGRFSIEGSFTKNFTDTTWKDLFRDDESKYVRITIEGTENLGSDNKPKIEVLFNKVMVTDWTKSSENDEVVTESVSFKAFYNTSDSQQSQVDLVNGTEEYSVAPTA